MNILYRKIGLMGMSGFDRIPFNRHTVDMEEVINEIIAKEKESESIVQEARQKAQEIQLDAENHVQSVIQDAKEKAADIYSKRVASVEDEAHKAYEESLDSVRGMKDSLFAEKADTVKELVETITEAVLTSDL